jgi:hypothetical protein
MLNGRYGILARDAVRTFRNNFHNKKLLSRETRLVLGNSLDHGAL